MGRDYFILFSVSKKGWDAKYRSYAILLFYIKTLFRCLPQRPNSGGRGLFMSLPTLAPPPLPPRIICTVILHM